jgi:hypothetical protein
MDVCDFRHAGFSTSALPQYHLRLDPPASLDTGGAHRLIDSIGPEGAWKLRRFAHPLGKTTYLPLDLLAKTNTFVLGTLKYCLSHCVASVHELLMTLM